jgi:cytochrome c553
MTALLSGVDDAQLNSMALYYAQQNPAQAQTPAVGNPAAGKTAAALCAGAMARLRAACRIVPSLAGQDARYLTRLDQGLQERFASEGDRLRRLPWRARCRKQAGNAEPRRPEPAISRAGTEGLPTGRRQGSGHDGVDVRASTTRRSKVLRFCPQQAPAQAQSPAVGNPAAGKTAAALCIGCHGDGAGTCPDAVEPVPARRAYLSAAIKAFKNDSRHRSSPARPCQRERGITSNPGTPSLAGLAPQYLVEK